VYERAADFWALGNVLYEMLTGHIPHAGQEVFLPAYLSPEISSLLRELLEPEPERRIGSKGGAKEIKAHPFFASVNFQLIQRKYIETPFKLKVRISVE
jgi:serine/threonine protein kinase